MCKKTHKKQLHKKCKYESTMNAILKTLGIKRLQTGWHTVQIIQYVAINFSFFVVNGISVFVGYLMLKPSL